MTNGWTYAVSGCAVVIAAFVVPHNLESIAQANASNEAFDQQEQGYLSRLQVLDLPAELAGLQGLVYGDPTHPSAQYGVDGLLAIPTERLAELATAARDKHIEIFLDPHTVLKRGDLLADGRAVEGRFVAVSPVDNGGPASAAEWMSTVGHETWHVYVQSAHPEMSADEDDGLLQLCDSFRQEIKDSYARLYPDSTPADRCNETVADWQATSTFPSAPSASWGSVTPQIAADTALQLNRYFNSEYPGQVVVGKPAQRVAGQVQPAKLLGH